MSAETLRRAAALMRERAEAVPVQPETKADVHGVWLGSRYHFTWHPAVAFAVADWLTVVADRFDALLDTFAPGSRAGAVTAAENVTGWQEALAVAHTYLGEIESFRPERGAE